MFDGYGVAGAPVEAPVPDAGIVIRAGFENVWLLVVIDPKATV
jgi:hypothetical protein